MCLKISLIVAAVSLGFIGNQASANVCDYRLSELIGGGGAAATGGLIAASGIAAKGLGFYTLTHAVTGATMLGSTAAGVSGAGTAGIIAGTGAGVGAAMAFIMAPATIIAGVVIGAGIGLSEGACYFQDERITSFDDVLDVMKGLAASADADYFQLDTPPSNPSSAKIFISNEDGELEYAVEHLYIVNGVLKYRDWGPNTVIGNVGLLSAKQSTQE